MRSAHDESGPSFGDDAPGASADPLNASSAGSVARDDVGARPKRRRGTRGGRRRRGAKKTTDEPVLGGAPERTPGGVFEAAEDDENQADGPEADGDADAAFESSERTPDSIQLVPGGPARKRKRRGGRRRRGHGTDRDAVLDANGPVEPDLPGESDDFTVRPGAGVPRELDAFHDEERGESDGDNEPHDVGARNDEGENDDSARTAGGGKKRRRRGSRGGRGRKEVAAPSRGRSDRPALSRGAPTRGAPTRGAPTRGAPTRTAAEIETIPGEDDDLPELPELPADAELLTAPRSPARDVGVAPGRGRPQRKKRGEKRSAPRSAPAEVEEIESDDPIVVPESQRTSLILVNATDPEEQRVAVVEDDRIADFQMTVKDQDSLVNDIYRGRVVNLEPAIGAAFIDFGQGRNGFLHTSDVLSMYGDKDWSLDKLLSAKIDPEEWDADSSQPGVSVEMADDDAPKSSSKRDEGARRGRRPVKPEAKRRFRSRPRLPITDLLKKGQMVVVQVTKDAIGDKGPTLTTYISIPGRYLVLMPSMARTGVSRKIEDEKERRRLKRILQALDISADMGVIVRTAGVGHSKDEIKRDLDYLESAWDAFGKRLSVGHGPAPLYRESDVAIRTMRDLFTPTTKAVIVDDPEVHRHICEFTEKLMPENVDRVKLHQGQRPLFQSYGIEPEFEKIFSRRIELPSGGSIVFDQAEALVAIDVNSGRTRSDGFDFEEIALKTNIEAVPEIARQIRLRDLGGIIVVDFIDMMKLANIRTVERAFQKELDSDRARSKIGRISQFGLLELTRQRLGPGMSRKVFHSCTRCRGTGRIRTVNSRAAAILRRLGAAMVLKGFSTVEVRAHPEVSTYLKDQCSEYIRALEYRFQREVKIFDAPEQHEDSVLRYLRADGKEVRPGGRRKK